MYNTAGTLISVERARRELNLSKRIHRFGHATAGEIKYMMYRTRLDKKKIEQSCETVYDACPIFSATGRPSIKKKVSTSHVKEAFNEKIQVDLIYVKINNERIEVLNIVYIETQYGERTITGSRTTEEIKKELELNWLYRHGASKELSSDYEFFQPIGNKYLKQHIITLNHVIIDLRTNVVA